MGRYSNRLLLKKLVDLRGFIGQWIRLKESVKQVVERLGDLFIDLEDLSLKEENKLLKD